jgi:asparagine synthase (glutamine-hydrolysing)
MPGIAGIISATWKPEMGKQLDAMLNCLKHEGSRTTGCHVEPRLGAGVCWTCLDGADGDCLPMWNEAKDICLIFSGEHFGGSQEAARLKANGHQFDPQNAGWLVHLYEELGNGFFERLNGWFSGVLLDTRRQTAVLFNDRYGLQRIYYHQNEDGFYFGTEAKGILEVLPGLRRLDMEGLGQSVACGCALRDRTIFSGISLLPGGAAWTFSPGRPLTKDLYFNRRVWEELELLGGEEFYHELRERFPRILEPYLGGRSRVGMSLTGGLDGRMIMAWAGRPPGTLPCYTFGGVYRDCTDVTVARRVARACGQPHQVIPVDEGFLREFPTLAEKAIYLSDGAMDVTGAVELYVNRVAREIAPVRLTGNYGSEIVRRNVAFKAGGVGTGLFAPDFERQLESAANTYEEEARCHSLSFIAFKQVPWHHYSRLSIERSQLTLRAPYLDNELVALMYRAPAGIAESREPSLRLIADGNAELGRIPTDRGIVLRPPPLVGRMRNLWQEFTFRAEYAYDYGMPQWLARADHLLAPAHLERLFLGRHKFYHFRVWYRDQLAGYIKSMLLDPRALARPYVRKERVEQIVNDHASGRGNHTSELHRLLRLELIQRQLIERRG